MHVRVLTNARVRVGKDLVVLNDGLPLLVHVYSILCNRGTSAALEHKTSTSSQQSVSNLKIPINVTATNDEMRLAGDADAGKLVGVHKAVCHFAERAIASEDARVLRVVDAAAAHKHFGTVLTHIVSETLTSRRAQGATAQFANVDARGRARRDVAVDNFRI